MKESQRRSFDEAHTAWLLRMYDGACGSLSAQPSYDEAKRYRRKVALYKRWLKQEGVDVDEPGTGS